MSSSVDVKGLFDQSSNEELIDSFLCECVCVCRECEECVGCGALSHTHTHRLS